MSQSAQTCGVLLFGATGGIGSALARQLAPLDCRFTLAARHQFRLDALAVVLHAEACSGEATEGLKEMSPPVYGYFDPPWMPAFLRRNEVMPRTETVKP